MKELTVDDKVVVLALKVLRRSVPVKEVAEFLGATTRAVATAARKPTADGRITTTYKKRGASATYRFVRLTAKPKA